MFIFKCYTETRDFTGTIFEWKSQACSRTKPFSLELQRKTLPTLNKLLKQHKTIGEIKSSIGLLLFNVFLISLELAK